jgi:Zn-dependent peptidase ImmA (M78 family)
LEVVLTRLQRLGWNSQSLTYDDFETACYVEGVAVRRVPLGGQGLYSDDGGQPVILLDSELRGAFLTFVAWHELAHHLLHDTGIRHFAPGTLDKADHQAHLIAACALLPRPAIRSKSLNELKESYDLPEWVWEFRYRVYKERGL